MALVPGREAVLSCLRGGWKNIADLNLRPADREVEKKTAIHENEMVITVSIGGWKDGRIELALIYPYLPLEPYIGILG
jgi:flagellar motor switch protein FliM